MTLPPFEVVEPLAGERPVVVEVPHAGLFVDAESLAFTLAPARSIARDADLFVDRLFQDAPSEGATLLVANVSRYVVDLNRGEDDIDSESVEGAKRGNCPRGVVWRLTTDGDPVLASRLPRDELERRLASVYRPYHATLDAILSRKRDKFGYAILLCAHSMPGRSRANASRADVVPGTRGRTTAFGEIIDAVDLHARQRGWVVRHDEPYRGGYTTARHGRPEHGSHAVQLELARRLYMEESSCRIDPKGFEAVRQFARTLVARLGSVEDHAGALRAHGPST